MEDISASAALLAATAHAVDGDGGFSGALAGAGPVFLAFLAVHVPAALIGLPAFLHAAGISCCQRLGDITAGLDPGGEDQAAALLGGLQAESSQR